ncbi:Hypothetical_protein [Hexamita inflata]|uniref:Hypothetical_protein n=1 Tax=Hexamita inflata TaxID=28002 RepID=A0ABP1GH79_9EUKA
MLITFLPEITDSFLSKHCCLAVARANEEAKLHYTSLITNALHECTIATKQGQKDRQATRRTLLEGAKPKAMLDRTGSEQPLTIEDLEHEKNNRQLNRNKRLNPIRSKTIVVLLTLQLLIHKCLNDTLQKGFRYKGCRLQYYITLLKRK